MEQSADGKRTRNQSGFPRDATENLVEYYIFLLPSSHPNQIRLSHLETTRQQALSFVQSLTHGYIWQKEEFNLELKRDQGLTYLHGEVDYGDSVEDEWLIVYALREFTKKSADLWVRCLDSDGEFLLIEAANVLPSWLTPENDANRAWIHDGKLLLASPPENGPRSGQANHLEPLILTEAVQLLKQEPARLIHSTLIESEAFYRLERYPGQIQGAIHHSRLIIPRAIALVLHELPKSVALAVEAFYLRDANTMKSLSSTTLAFPPDDLVSCSVRFSKVLFAQLKSQRFEMPHRWRQVLQKAQSQNEVDPSYLVGFEMGMKLTCGYEMLNSRLDQHQSRLSRELRLVLDDIRDDGVSALPTNEEMLLWPDVWRHDDEMWLDINYEDFERELEGKRNRAAGGLNSGFGEVKTQEDLRKVVSRFEAFLNDDNAGLNGAELDAMDDDGEDQESDNTNDECESADLEVSFDEAQFSSMMREMTGFSVAPMQTDDTRNADGSELKATHLDQAGEDKAIRTLSAQMEAELHEHGALPLNSSSTRYSTVTLSSQRKTELPKWTSSDANIEYPGDVESRHEGAVDIDFNLAKNLLESFKSQAGLAGPAGNLLGIMGFHLPPDADDSSGNTQKD